ncbi:MAG: type II toxin-antitoxin system VapB family antitoxin [Gammaproteobacteria bacterium]|nr:type II toxin-antitoxin system VapB family antitoxin [Gammaproteobacteria bacterium]
MATNLAIDANLLDEALLVGGLATKKDTVNQALTEYVQRRKQQVITKLFGNLPCDEGYDCIASVGIGLWSFSIRELACDCHRIFIRLKFSALLALFSP